MEEERFVINNEEINQNTIDVKENNQNTIDIEENISDVPHEETIQIIEVNEPEIYNIGSDEAFSSLGEQNEQLNHSLMHGRDLPNQHPISAITGLRTELDEIESLKTVESDKRGYANYYIWDTIKELPPDDRIGYFVSIHTKDHKISICDEESDIFGVTVNSAGFIGWQHYDEENNPRDDQYALVANTGVVKVRCRSSVVAGDYVMSGNDGWAKKSTNKHGYHVISIDDTNGTRYAVISLDSSMNQLYSMSQEVDSFNERVSNVEINTAAAINAANAALKKGIMTGVNTAINNAQTAIDNSEFAMGAIDDLKGALSEEIEQIKAEALATQEANKNTINELKQDALDTNKVVEDLQSDVAGAQEGVKNTLDEARRLADELEEINRYLSNDYEIIETWTEDPQRDKSKIWYVKDEKLYYYYDVKSDLWVSVSEPTKAGLSEAIVSIRQKIAENEAAIEELASYTGKDYVTIPVWNGYERVTDFNSIVPDSNIIYYDGSTGLWWQCDLSNSDNPWSSSSDQPSLNAAGSDISAGGSNPLELKDISQTYYAEDTGLYYYYSDGWHATVSPSIAALTEAVALTKKKADKNEASIETIVSYIGGEGSTIADVKNFADNINATISSLTSYIENGYEKCEVPWSEVEPKESGKIYYAKDSDDNDLWKYWYYKNDTQTWYGSVNPADAGLKVSAVNVQQTASNNEASIKKLINWKGETNDAISQLKQIADETGASIESIVMNISQYSVGKYSQAFGLTISEAKELLRDGAVFIPSEDTDESYKKDDDSFYARSFIKGYYYTWDKERGVWEDNGTSAGVMFGKEYVRGLEETPYFVVQDNYESSFTEIGTMEGCTPTKGMYYVKDEEKYYYYNSEWYPAQDPNFEIGALYHWEQKDKSDSNSYYWKKVSTLESNLLGRSIGKIKQSTSEIESTVVGVRGDLVSVKESVDDVKSLYIATTSFDDNMTSFEQYANSDSATLSMIAMTGIVVTENWDETGKDETSVYYDYKNKLYYYYDNGWISVPADEANDNKHINSKIKSAGIITAINGDTSKTTISADRINLSGYITAGSLKYGGTTEIDGSRIKTGYIKSDNYSEGGPVFRYSVTTDYGFTQLSNGWYEANDVASDGDHARCLVTLTMKTQGNVIFEIENDCEKDVANNFICYGVFTNYDTWEEAKNDDNSYKTISGDIKSSYVYESVPEGIFKIWVYYKKADGADTTKNHFRFRVSPSVLPKAGTKIDLVNGSISAPKFSIDKQGNARLQGLLETNNIESTNIIIDGNDIIWRDTRRYTDDPIKNNYRTAGILLEPSEIAFTSGTYVDYQNSTWSSLLEASKKGEITLDTGMVYYAQDDDGVLKYWYYNKNAEEWLGTTNPAAAGLGGVNTGHLYIGSARNISFCGFYGDEDSGYNITPMETVRIDQYIHTEKGYPAMVSVYPTVTNSAPAGENALSFLGTGQNPWNNLFVDVGYFNKQITTKRLNTAKATINDLFVRTIEGRIGKFTSELELTGYLETDNLKVNNSQTVEGSLTVIGTLNATNISGAIDYDSISGSVASALENFKGTLKPASVDTGTLKADKIILGPEPGLRMPVVEEGTVEVLIDKDKKCGHARILHHLGDYVTIVCSVNNNCAMVVDTEKDKKFYPDVMGHANRTKVYLARDRYNNLRYYKWNSTGGYVWVPYATMEEAGVESKDVINYSDQFFDDIPDKKTSGVYYAKNANGDLRYYRRDNSYWIPYATEGELNLPNTAVDVPPVLVKSINVCRYLGVADIWVFLFEESNVDAVDISWIAAEYL